MRFRRFGITVAAFATATLALVPTAGALTSGTAKDQPYLVTLVARQCPSYGDITANLARNNIMESLQDLGPDTAYVSGQPIDPTIESTHQPKCTPLRGFQFSFGTALAGKVKGLTTVRGAYDPVTVLPTTPLLNSEGQPTGSHLATAVTVQLTPEQAQLALQRSSLWLQGGTPTDPLPNSEHIAFGALRCSIDNLNGDNAEWVGFSAGAHHAFCYYYAVSVPTAPGTIVIKKTLPTGEVAKNSFPFQGNISYNPGGTFSVAAGSQVSFDRASGETWDVTELPTAGFGFVRLSCTSSNGASTIHTSGTTATIDLGESDHVVCTYENKRTSTELSVFKQTRDGHGGPFGFTVVPPSGSSTSLSATTTASNTPVLAGVVHDVTIGHYRVTETLPAATAEGHWIVSAFDCNGVSQAPSLTEEVDVTSVREDIACTFTNQLIPTGSVTIQKISTNGVGRFEFSMLGTNVASEQPVRFEAVTTADNVATTAVQQSGKPVNPLVFGTYSIDELAAVSPSGFTWQLDSVDCGAALVSSSSSGAVIDVTAANPHVTCTFTNSLVADSATLPPVTEPEIPFTGAPSSALWWASGLAIVAGALLVLFSRRRTA